MTEQQLAEQLSPTEQMVLCASSDGHWVYPARSIAQKIDRPLVTIRLAQRRLRSLGLLGYGFLMREDDGKLCGQGYYLSHDGAQVVKFIERANAEAAD